MQQNQYLSFDVYRLDVHNECVWRGKQVLRLTTKAFAVLHYLMAHAGRLVTKEELFQAVWPDIVRHARRREHGHQDKSAQEWSRPRRAWDLCRPAAHRAGLHSHTV
jgi:DNA-binding response OmpR family regulator